MCRSTSVGSEFYLKLWAELFVKLNTKYLLILKYDLGLSCTPLKLASIQLILKAVLIEILFENKIVQMKVYTLAVQCILGDGAMTHGKYWKRNNYVQCNCNHASICICLIDTCYWMLCNITFYQKLDKHKIVTWKQE